MASKMRLLSKVRKTNKVKRQSKFVAAKKWGKMKLGVNYRASYDEELKAFKMERSKAQAIVNDQLQHGKTELEGDVAMYTNENMRKRHLLSRNHEIKSTLGSLWAVAPRAKVIDPIDPWNENTQCYNKIQASSLPARPPAPIAKP